LIFFYFKRYIFASFFSCNDTARDAAETIHLKGHIHAGVDLSRESFAGFKENRHINRHINQINYVKVHIWVHSVTVIKKNEPLEQMLSPSVKIMPRPFDLYIGRTGGPAEFSVAGKRTL